VSQAYLHPEFGWFCPPLSFRRRARVAVAFLAVLGIVGALALNAGHDPKDDGLLTVRGAEARFKAETIQTVGRSADTTAESSRPLEGSKVACEGGTWSYTDGKCRVGKGTLRSPRAANEAGTIAALPLGRSTLPTSSAAPIDPPGAANTAVPTPALSDPPSNLEPKKVRKALRSQNDRDWDWRGDRRRDRAYRPWGWSW
jgi:hypothetical protein